MFRNEKKDCGKNERKKFDKSMCIMTVVLLKSVISSDGITNIWPRETGMTYLMERRQSNRIQSNPIESNRIQSSSIESMTEDVSDLSEKISLANKHQIK